MNVAYYSRDPRLVDIGDISGLPVLPTRRSHAYSHPKELLGGIEVLCLSDTPFLKGTRHKAKYSMEKAPYNVASL